MAQGNTKRARRLVFFAACMNVGASFPLCNMAQSGEAWLWLLVLLLAADVCVGWYALSTGLLFERRVERIWNATCGGIGFVSEKSQTIMNPLWAVGGSATRQHEAKKYPMLREVKGNRTSWTGYVTAFAGQDPSDYNEYADKFAFAFMVPNVSFEASEDGRIRIYAGQVPVPEAYDFQPVKQTASSRVVAQAVPPSRKEKKQTVPVDYSGYGSDFNPYAPNPWSNPYSPNQRSRLSMPAQLERAKAASAQVKKSKYQRPNAWAAQQPASVSIADQPVMELQMPAHALADIKTRPLSPVVPPVQAVRSYDSERALLRSVPMAVDMQGRWWHMPIEETHVLVAARTGGGKGSWVWSLVLRLEPSWRAGLVKFWGCDPKRLELAIGSDWWEHYADTDVGMVELLEQAVREMFTRGSRLQGVARKFTPSPQTPLHVIVIDELGYLSSLLTDRKLQMRADIAIKTLLMQGRSNGFAVVGAVQDPRKATVEYRDLFPIRIAGGLNEGKMVDLVLGEGMHDKGAVCEQIPLGRKGAGVAFVLDAEAAMKPRMVRAAWVSDATIRDALTPRVRALAEAYEVKDEY